MTARQNFLNRVHDAFSREQKLTVVQLRKFADEYGLPQDDKDLWELTELAWVLWYREISTRNRTEPVKTFEEIVAFYQKTQPTFTARDSTRKIFQQYSTSAPIAWLAGWFTDSGKPNPGVFEPSAGNGLLTIYYRPGYVSVNEIDPTRSANLKGQGFSEVTDFDASLPFPNLQHDVFDAVLTNPPFGALGEVNRDYGWGFRKLDHVMVAHALATMRDDGRAAILIGGHTEFDEKNGLVKSGRAFFDWLFRHYRVVDMINIDSGALYAKQGTSFPLRLILVTGRKAQPFGFGPNHRDHPQYAEVVPTFDALFQRVQKDRELAAMKELTLDDLLEIETAKIEMEQSLKIEL